MFYGTKLSLKSSIQLFYVYEFESLLWFIFNKNSIVKNLNKSVRKMCWSEVIPLCLTNKFYQDDHWWSWWFFRILTFNCGFNLWRPDPILCSHRAAVQQNELKWDATKFFCPRHLSEREDLIPSRLFAEILPVIPVSVQHVVAKCPAATMSSSILWYEQEQKSDNKSLFRPVLAITPSRYHHESSPGNEVS